MNLKSIVSSSVLSGVIAVIALTPSTANAASDYKTFNASGGCKVYGATPWTALGYGWQGVANSSGSTQYIICPLPTDSDIPWNGVDNAQIHVHARTAVSVGGTVTCLVYTAYADQLVSTTTVSIPMVANTGNSGGHTSTYLTSYGDAADGGAMILCQLPVGTTLAHYSLWEFSATNTP